MKRILFLVPRMNIGGAETYVYTAAKELRARGYEVFLASGGGRLADKLKAAGVRTFFVLMKLLRAKALKSRAYGDSGSGVPYAPVPAAPESLPQTAGYAPVTACTSESVSGVITLLVSF